MGYFDEYEKIEPVQRLLIVGVLMVRILKQNGYDLFTPPKQHWGTLPNGKRYKIPLDEYMRLYLDENGNFKFKFYKWQPYGLAGLISKFEKHSNFKKISLKSAIDIAKRRVTQTNCDAINFERLYSKEIRCVLKALNTNVPKTIDKHR